MNRPSGDALPIAATWHSYGAPLSTPVMAAFVVVDVPSVEFDPVALTRAAAGDVVDDVDRSGDGRLPGEPDLAVSRDHRDVPDLARQRHGRRRRRRGRRGRGRDRERAGDVLEGERHRVARRGRGVERRLRPVERRAADARRHVPDDLERIEAALELATFARLQAHAHRQQRERRLVAEQAVARGTDPAHAARPRRRACRRSGGPPRGAPSPSADGEPPTPSRPRSSCRRRSAGGGSGRGPCGRPRPRRAGSPRTSPRSAASPGS